MLSRSGTNLDVGFAYAARDELRVLRTEIENQNHSNL